MRLDIDEMLVKNLEAKGISIAQKLSDREYVSSYRGYSSTYNQPVIIKVFKKQALKQGETETNILTKLGGRYSPKLYNYFYMDEALVLVIEELQGITLKDFTLKFLNTDRKEKKEIIEHILERMLKMIASLHESGYVHRDLKPENIFIKLPSKNNPKSSNLYLIDFDSSGSLKQGKAPKIYSQGYSHPTTYTGEVSILQDLFSCGKILSYLWLRTTLEPIGYIFLKQIVTKMDPKHLQMIKFLLNVTQEKIGFQCAHEALLYLKKDILPWIIKIYNKNEIMQLIQSESFSIGFQQEKVNIATVNADIINKIKIELVDQTKSRFKITNISCQNLIVLQPREDTVAWNKIQIGYSKEFEGKIFISSDVRERDNADIELTHIVKIERVFFRGGKNFD